MDWLAITDDLTAPLAASAIKPPPAGKYGEYVDAYHVICEANRIFGHGGWSYTITRMDRVSKVSATDRNGNEQIRVGYMCTVQVTVGETVREGSAVGSGMAKPENEADAHESAVKEAETDALKRALRCFGNTFGLALYEKDKAKRQVEDDSKPAFNPRAAADRIKAALAKASTVDDLRTLWNVTEADALAALDAAAPAMRAEVKAAMLKRKDELSAPKPQPADAGLDDRIPF